MVIEIRMLSPRAAAVLPDGARVEQVAAGILAASPTASARAGR